jgi:AcrR family transcriptional regulator
LTTKERILDTAERLIGEQGYAATSLRQIIGEAGVNLAAVHYHFGSKEELLDGIIARKAGPVNERRTRLFDEAEQASNGGPVPVEAILSAFLRPIFEAKERNPEFVRIMGRIHGEGMMPSILKRHFHPIVVRFRGLMLRALPHLDDQELGWRLEMMFGGLSIAMWHRPIALEAEMAGLKALPRVVSFFGAAFRSPVVAKEE